MYEIVTASEKSHFEAGVRLFREYADSLDFSLDFQNFDEELAKVDRMYGKPSGCLLLVKDGGEFVGVAGLRQIENPQTSEIKRMYIRPGYRGKGVGKKLMEALLRNAAALGYGKVKLDTIEEKMPGALKLYRAFGFVETAPYNYNPHKGIVYLEKQL